MDGIPELSRSPSFFSPKDAAQLRERLAEIDAEILELQARLVCLATARKPIVHSLKSASFPVVSIPPEIIAEIFLHYVDSAHIGGTGSGAPYAPGTRAGGFGPLILASVCRAWRAVAISLPSIWSTVQLYAVPDTISPTEKLLQCWLPRAASHSLDIQIGSPSGLDLLMPLISPYSLQLRSFSCGFDTPISFPEVLIRGRIPSLRRLEVSLEVTREEVIAPVTAFFDAPALRDVHLIDFTFAWILLPWGQLTNFECSGQTAAECLEMLQYTPLLEALTVDLSPPDNLSAVAVRLDRLHTLKFSKYQESIHLIDHLTLPLLTHLELPVLTQQSASHLVGFFARTAPSLDSVAICDTPAYTTLACLHAMPTVSAVRLTDPPGTPREFSEIFDALTHDAGLLPNLKSLSLSPCSGVEIPYASLADMLTMRRRAHLTLFELNCEEDRPFEPPIDVVEVQRSLEILEVLATGGLNMKIRGLQKLSGSVDPWALCPR
ncbi:hypothetical protein B0H15DRAFT_956870 [Mycena belliarum]|uniref:F-box domain-containing protein n=1 Tax=Mycena belliarum TaxID=1033014 RepID=A0AAD6TTB4_9AGAR|nr:hypothetical protein B0H15DRAFT_956870 [Mycena belliae]